MNAEIATQALINIEGYKEISLEKGQIPALSEKARKMGVFEVYKPNGEERLVVSPIPLQEGLVETNGVQFPVKKGITSNGKYVYQIPKSSYALERLNLSYAAGQRPNIDPQAIIDEFLSNNGGLGIDPSDKSNWAVSKVTLVPFIFPDNE